MTEPEPGSEPPSTADRLRKVEISLEMQGENLTKIYEMLLEQDRLTDSIGRLGEGAGTLSAALLQVAAQQKVLARLDEDLQQVKEHSATTEDLAKVEEHQHVEALQFRKQVLRRIFATAMVLASALAIVGLVILGVLQSRQDATQAVCEARTEQNLIIIDVLERTLTELPAGPRADQVRVDIERFRALNTDCGEL